MNKHEFIDHLCQEFKRKVKDDAQNEADVMRLLESYLFSAYARGALEERASQVATDCFGG